MNKALIATLLGVCSVPTFAADVGVSISVGQPGFYGQIDIGNVPRPAVVYAEPVVIVRSPEYVRAQPIYLHVPPGHEKHWSKHCAEYRACGRPVYFVRDDWYNNEYVPRYKMRDREDGDKGHGHDHGNSGHGQGKGHRNN